MRADDLFSSHDGLRDLLINFRQAGRNLNVPEQDLGGLISSAHSLSCPISILILGDDVSGKSSFINNFFKEDYSDYDKGVVGPKIWKYGETSRLYEDSDFTEFYLPESILKRINFIEYPIRKFTQNLEQIKKAYLVSDIVFLIVPAIDPWSTEVYDFISDLEVIALRPFAGVLTHSDLRTEEENRAFTEYISDSSKSALGYEVPVFMIPFSKYYQSSNSSSDGLFLLFEWIKEKINEQSSICKKLIRAEKNLLNATERIAKTMEDSSRIDNSMTEDVEIIEKLIDLSSDEIVHELAECLYDDLREFEKASRILRSGFQRLTNLPIAAFLIDRKLTKSFEVISDSINESSEKITSTFTNIGQEIDSCNQSEQSKLYEFVNEYFPVEKNQINAFKIWYDKKNLTLIDQIKDSFMDHFSSRPLALSIRIIPRFFILMLAFISIIFIYSHQNYFLSPLFLTSTISILLGINCVLLLNQRRKILNTFDGINSQFRNKLENVLGDHYRLIGEKFFQPYQESRALLQNFNEKQSKKILKAKECVINAVENAKKLLAKS